MQQTIRQQRVALAIGILRWRATITSSEGIPDRLLDLTTGDIGNSLFDDIVASKEFYAPDAALGTSWAKHRVSFEAGGVIVDIEAVLTVNRPNLDSKVSFVLGHALGSISSIPVAIADAAKKMADEARRAAMHQALGDILTGGHRMASPFGGPVFASLFGDDLNFMSMAEFVGPAGPQLS